jgi:hypothetical protein
MKQQQQQKNDLGFVFFFAAAAPLYAFLLNMNVLNIDCQHLSHEHTDNQHKQMPPGTKHHATARYPQAAPSC